MAKFYGENSFALGYLTLPDFFIAEFSFYVKGLDQGLYESFPFFQRLKEEVSSLPKIKEYYLIPTNANRPFNPPIVNFKPTQWYPDWLPMNIGLYNDIDIIK